MEGGLEWDCTRTKLSFKENILFRSFALFQLISTDHVLGIQSGTDEKMDMICGRVGLKVIAFLDFLMENKALKILVEY